MKKHAFLLICLAIMAFANGFANPVTVKSPDGKLELSFEVVDGVPQYALNREGKPVVLPSKMGFTLEWRDDLAHAFVLKSAQYDHMICSHKPCMWRH